MLLQDFSASLTLFDFLSKLQQANSFFTDNNQCAIESKQHGEMLLRLNYIGYLNGVLSCHLFNLNLFN